MPMKPQKTCARPGCKALVRGRTYCARHTSEKQKEADKKRPNAAGRGYGRKWRELSRRFLDSHPLCRMCQDDGQPAVPATEVDHIKPHRGDEALMWDQTNWQALCKRHHARKTATMDGGFGNQPQAPAEPPDAGDRGEDLEASSPTPTVPAPPPPPPIDEPNPAGKPTGEAPDASQGQPEAPSGPEDQADAEA